jgi:hypothetical protein
MGELVVRKLVLAASQQARLVKHFAAAVMGQRRNGRINHATGNTSTEKGRQQGQPLCLVEVARRDTRHQEHRNGRSCRAYSRHADAEDQANMQNIWCLRKERR